MSKPFALLAGSALATILTLTGCGAQDDGSEAATDKPTTQSPAPTGPEAIVKDGESLAPGTELALGDTVTATASEAHGEEGDFTATISLTPTEVKQGQNADFDVLTDASQHEGKIPVYVYSQMEVVEIEGGDEHTTISPGLRAWTSDDEQVPVLILQVGLGGDTGPLCAGGESLQAGDVPLVAGDSALNCLIFVVPEGESIEKITYQNNMIVGSDDTSYDMDPIAWVL